MKQDSMNELTDLQEAELKTLAELPDDQVDMSEIPEVLDWSDSRRGVFYRRVKQQITLRLDADVIAWFRRNAPGGKGYHTDINRALRNHVLRESRNRPVP